jgi:CheY-like chemotaxis protein
MPAMCSRRLEVRFSSCSPVLSKTSTCVWCRTIARISLVLQVVLTDSAGEREQEPRKLSLQSIRVLLVDDSADIRQALCSLLSAHIDFEIVCESVNGLAAISKAAELQPDVILLDINLPDMNGLEVAKRMKAVSPSAEILLLSEHDLFPMVQEGLRAGARGYLLKSDAPRELATAIRQVHKKEQYVGLRFPQ